jgi:hypothetical protein
MIPEKRVMEFLQDVQKSYPHSVHSRLDKGDLVQKSMDLSYEIDDPEIYRGLGEYPAGAVPHGKIYKALDNSKEKILKLFENEGKRQNGKTVLPFSRAYELKIGECLEKAILVQLCAQKGRNGFIVNGYLCEDDMTLNPHGYNVVFKDSQSFLLDAHNPLEVDGEGNVTIGYIAPLIGIDTKEMEFIVPHEFRHGRAYVIF